MNETITVSSIQRFSLQDGPGIRTTVFIKGCSLHCPWCSNPECLVTESLENDTVYTADQLLNKCLKDRLFYGNGGGVTFSGGECLLQAKSLTSVLQGLKQNCIHTAVETSLYIPRNTLDTVSDLIDLFYVDVKILDPKRCSDILNADVSLFLNNLDYLISVKSKKVMIRIPVIGRYTDDQSNIDLVYKLLKKYKNGILKIELLKEHNLARKKYERLNLNYEYHGVDDKVMLTYRSSLESIGIPVKILGI